jgi:hypothetical protein
VPRSRDLLARFRPVGTPGAAAGPGVPADTVADLAAELEPVLSRLEDTVGETRRIREAGAQEAAERRRRGHEQALAMAAQAGRDADAERAAAAARGDRRVAPDSAATLARGHAEAEAVRVTAAERTSPLADRVVAAVRASIGAS